jgi:sugar lactone lactonase YvrE
VGLALDGSEGYRYIVADEYDGKPLNSPNDVIVVRKALAGSLTAVRRSQHTPFQSNRDEPNNSLTARDTQSRTDGSVWFTDPDYGLRAGRHVVTYREEPLQKANHVFRVPLRPDDSKPSSKVEAMTAALHRPNGLCFSPDETLLYVADSGGLWGPTFDEDGAHHVMVFDVIDGGEYFKMAWRATLNRDVSRCWLCIDWALQSYYSSQSASSFPLSRWWQSLLRLVSHIFSLN